MVSSLSPLDRLVRPTLEPTSPCCPASAVDARPLSWPLLRGRRFERLEPPLAAPALVARPPLVRLLPFSALPEPSPPDELPVRLRSRRSDRGRRPRLGGGATGRTRAWTRASPRRRPKSPGFGSLKMTNSASSSATPSRSRTVSLASESDLPLASTHSTSYRAFLARFAFDLGCGFSVFSSSASPAAEPADRARF